MTMKSYIARHQPHQPLHLSVTAGIGGLIAIGVLGALSVYSGSPLIMAPFGASCVLLFSAPASPLSQPANVIGGHLISTLVGLLVRLVLPNEWWAVAIAIGLAIGIMSALRLTHPPAGADPLVVFAENPGFEFLIMPVLIGTTFLVLIASIYHRYTKGIYPIGKS